MRTARQERYRILIADDDPMTQRLLKSFLGNLGYKVTSVMDGDAAIKEIQKGDYDLLISDLVMPGIDGIQLTKRIKNMAGYHNFPIILLSGKNSVSSKVEAFESLVNDYVTKPFDFDELAARIKTQLRLKRLQEEIEYKNRLLSKRNLELETHLDIARRIQRHYLPLDIEELQGVKIISFYRPIDKVGGDIFDLIPIRDGKIGVFIGDVSGHGVPAVFQNILLKMTLRSIVKEEKEEEEEEEEILPPEVLEKINRKVIPYLQCEDFITALYAIVDTNNRMLFFASAGHPRGILIRKKEEKIEFMEGRGLCMGVMDHVTYEGNAVKLSPGDRIILYTDGLIEVRNSQGKMVGTKGLYEIVSRCAREHSLDRMASTILHEIERYCGRKEYEDDITLLCLEMRDSFCQSWPTMNINTEDVIEKLMNPLSSLNRIDEKDIKKVRIALHEALTNAIEHGNLDMPPFLRYSDPLDMAYEKLKEIRQSNPKYRDKRVTTRYLIHDEGITYFIKDEGPGFDYKNIEDPTSPENIAKCYGRGIALIKMYMDEVSFNDKGNEITLTKRFLTKS